MPTTTTTITMSSNWAYRVADQSIQSRIDALRPFTTGKNGNTATGKAISTALRQLDRQIEALRIPDYETAEGTLDLAGLDEAEEVLAAARAKRPGAAPTTRCAAQGCENRAGQGHQYCPRCEHDA